MRDINLKATEHFEAVARLGSVTRAAEELMVSPSAVSQQIRQIEAQLGVKLFRREKQRLILTLDGDRLFQTATEAFAALRNARDAIARQREARNVILRVSPSFGVRWLGPRLPGFLARHGDWNIRVDATPDFSAFEAEAVDFDLRYGNGGWKGLNVFPILHDHVLPVVSPAYLAELEATAPGDPVAQLANARLVDSVKALTRWDMWLARQRITLPRLSLPLRFDRSSMSIEMARQGFGIALESTALCLPDLQSGALVPLSRDFDVLVSEAYWFVSPPQHMNRRIVRLFSEWLTAEGRAHDAASEALLTGLGCRLRDQGPEDHSALSVDQ
ncbi:LysR substrate-binding domain-containing protein [Szabonella alba]|uniref:LysR family transcriptional regulator n=1 Tax=Szabonella alba TaxID=2804194 RepID=A0A8K0VAY4_9RHOB|nr:LysR substrate-binding domain-containing protein [Szabonella alba]MBL4916439.1 LysR family transcriptional regulator [Szabonella alba]